MPLSYFLLCILSLGYYPLQRSFSLKEISFQELGFSVSKKAVIRLFGQPEVVFTNYECGFYTNDQANGPFYQLVYSGFNFIGSDKENFVLEHLDFDAKGTMKIRFGDKVLSGLTTKNDFIALFGAVTTEFFDENTKETAILLISKDSDDGARFIFEEGKLKRYQYWSPC